MMTGSQATDYCMQIYRAGVMHIWLVKISSKLCAMDTFVDKSDYAQVKTIEKMVHFKYGHESTVKSIDYNWKYECSKNKDDLAVAIYIPGSSGGNAVVFDVIGSDSS